MKNKPDSATIQAILAKAELLYSEAQIAQALENMARAIDQRFQHHHQPILCLSVMVGGLIPTGQLLPRLTIPLELDYIHATRYRATTTGGELHWLKYPNHSLVERTILIIDDILDEGVTLKAIIDHCYKMGALEVFSAVLVEKQHNRPRILQQADFTGLTVPDRYIFGYGMDYQEQLRHSPGIYAVHGL